MDLPGDCRRQLQASFGLLRGQGLAYSCIVLRAFQNAKKSAAEEFQRIAFNPSEIMKMLKVEIERGESTVDHRIDYHAAERRFAS